MATVSRPGETAPDAFVVVVNDQDQRALWQAGLDLPAAGGAHPPSWRGGECLAAIDAAWPDIAPASVRAGAGGHAADGGGGDRFVHEVFAEQAARRPDATAVIAGRTRLSYRELDSSANRLAHYLGEIGAGPESVIGVYLERGVDVIRAILAIMKAGAGYLPLDPSLPPERLSADLLPGTAGGGDRGPPGRVPRHRDAAAAAGRARRRARGPAGDGARRPACIRTTSATPSTPRGPPATPSRSRVSHGSLACVIGELAGEYEIADDDRVGADGVDGLRHVHRAGIRRADERRDAAAAAAGHDGAVGAAAQDRAQARHRPRPDAGLLAPAARAAPGRPTSGCAASG